MTTGRTGASGRQGTVRARRHAGQPFSQSADQSGRRSAGASVSWTADTARPSPLTFLRVLNPVFPRCLGALEKPQVKGLAYIRVVNPGFKTRRSSGPERALLEELPADACARCTGGRHRELAGWQGVRCGARARQSAARAGGKARVLAARTGGVGSWRTLRREGDPVRVRACTGREANRGHASRGRAGRAGHRAKQAQKTGPEPLGPDPAASDTWKHACKSARKSALTTRPPSRRPRRRCARRPPVPKQLAHLRSSPENRWRHPS